ncbi:hypothetical protein M3J09_001266 [Ascochyta lentis]
MLTSQAFLQPPPSTTDRLCQARPNSWFRRSIRRGAPDVTFLTITKKELACHLTMGTPRGGIA